MSTDTQIHLVSSNLLLDELYSLNLNIYVGAKPILHKTLVDAVEVASKSRHLPQLIICHQDKLPEIESSEKLISNLGKACLLITGVDRTRLSKSESVANKFDIREIVRKTATYFGVTASYMANKEVADYYPVSTKLFSILDRAFCDIYSDLSGGQMIIKKNGDVRKYLAEIEESIPEYFYISSQLRLSFINKATIYLMDYLREDEISNVEVLKISSGGMDIVAEEIFSSDEVTEEIASISRVCVKALSNVSNKVNKVEQLLKMLLSNKTGYIFNHSVLTTYIATNIIKNMDWGSKEQQEKVAFVLFFHDLYLVPLYQKYDFAIDEEELLFREELSAEEKETVFDHAQLISNLIKTFPKAPIGADVLAAQHHGESKGRGFPGVFGDDISPLAKVIVISQDVAKHILEHTHSGNTELAFDKDKIKIDLDEKFTKNSYKKLSEAFMKVSIF